MKTIKQRDASTGCGVAAFATATQGFRNYHDCLEWFKENGFVKTNQFVTVPAMKEAIVQYFGVTPELKYYLNKRYKLALCFGKYEGKNEYRHWFVYFEGHFYDPCPYINSPIKSTLHEITRVLVLKS
ncbi:MAG: hypothetical protein H9917_10200 [Candidatus Oceanisphaera merdipullorum]|nr:hypothetical protein [Candidatus Oceanisphaera merdipullorum]